MSTPKRVLTWLSACALTIMAQQAVAAEVGVPATGVGGAVTASVDDLSAIYWNPAALGGHKVQIGLAIGGPDTNAASTFRKIAADPLNWQGAAHVRVATLTGAALGQWGGAMTADGSLDLERTDATHAHGSADYLSRYTISGAHTLAKAPLGLGKLAFGASASALQGLQVTQSVAPDPGGVKTTTETYDGAGYALDLGASLKAAKGVLNFGVAWRNALADLNWHGQRTTAIDNGVAVTTSQADLPERSSRPAANLVFGAAISPPLLGLTAEVDVEQDGTMHYGLSKSFLFHALTMRIGEKTAPGGGAATIGVGAGVSLGPAHLDAAVSTADHFKNFDMSVGTAFTF